MYSKSAIPYGSRLILFILIKIITYGCKVTISLPILQTFFPFSSHL